MSKQVSGIAPIPKAVALALGGAFLASGAYAQSAQKQERIEITGSAIKRTVDAEGALPITTITAKELRETGVTSTEEALQKVAAMQTTLTSSQSVGSGTGGKASANLRGLGSNKTLVLLNGRRLAAFAFDSQSVDLNAIPFAAIERIEVLRDGASAIYGTDAVGGVINFITRSNFTGVDLSVESYRPSKPGGSQQRLSAAGGLGDLNKDGYNAWISYDVRSVEALAAIDRNFSRTGFDPSRGLSSTSGTSYPANFTYTRLSDQRLVGGNATRAAGCVPPLSIADPAFPATCRFDFTAMVDAIPEQELRTLAARGSFKLGNNIASLEFVRADNTNTARVASDPVTGLTMPITSPFYPRAFPGIDATKPVTVGWRMIPGGKRTNEAESVAQRAVFDLTGSYGDWDYKAGYFDTVSRAKETIRDGYVNKALIQAGVTSGLLNPFGDNTPAALAAITAAKMTGSPTQAKGTTKGFDLRVSRELFAMAGGNAGLSVGLEQRLETYRNDTDDAVVNAVPSLGRSPYHAGGTRRVTAFTGEMLFPVTKELELQLALRTDKYSDFGTSSNPKVGVRYQPMKSLVLRGSYNTGFRAPALDDLYGPNAVTFTSDSYNDPLLCPGGRVSAQGVDVRDCGQQPQALTGGDPLLKPETSKAFTLGFAFEPFQNGTISLDFWKIELKDQIGAFPEQAVFEDPSRFAARYTRCNQLSAAQQALYDRCQGAYANSRAIAFIDTRTSNLGGVKTNGFDLTAAYAFTTGLGRTALTYSGTIVSSYEYQRVAGDPFIPNVGKYVDSSPIFRGQHVIGLDQKMGALGVSFAIRHKSGYQDQNSGGQTNTVGAYTLADLGLNYQVAKGFVVAGGLKNLFDTDPPLTNQVSTFQRGYDPRFTDPTGRTLWLRVSYSAK